jgi:hypothetical protein
LLPIDGRKRQHRVGGRLERSRTLEERSGGAEVGRARFDRAHDEAHARRARIELAFVVGAHRERQERLGRGVDPPRARGVLGLVFAQDGGKDEPERCVQLGGLRRRDDAVGQDERRRFGKAELYEQSRERDVDVERSRIAPVGLDCRTEERGAFERRAISLVAAPNWRRCGASLGAPELIV